MQRIVKWKHKIVILTGFCKEILNINLKSIPWCIPIQVSKAADCDEYTLYNSYAVVIFINACERVAGALYQMRITHIKS